VERDHKNQAKGKILQEEEKEQREDLVQLYQEALQGRAKKVVPFQGVHHPEKEINLKERKQNVREKVDQCQEAHLGLAKVQEEPHQGLAKVLYREAQRDREKVLKTGKMVQEKVDHCQEAHQGLAKVQEEPHQSLAKFQDQENETESLTRNSYLKCTVIESIYKNNLVLR